MKLRISRDLHDRSRACADAVGDRLCTWIQIAARCRSKGTLDGVAVPAGMLSATRSDAVITIPGIDAEPAWLRETIAMAVLHCEARNPEPFTPPMLEGRDYIIAREYA